MASKQTELHVDDLLNSLDSRTTTKGAKDTKAAKVDNNDWDDQEEDNFALGIGRTQQATKAKAKKKTAAKGWGDIDAGSAPQQPTVQDFAAIQDGEKKKKIFNKPNGQAKAPVNFETEAEYFPSLGEERPKQAPKKPEPTPVAQPTVASSSGVKKFVNAKKQGAGENFVALEPVQERALPVVPEKTEPAVVQQKPAGFGFQRRAAEEQPKEVPADTKFKFGGEGPKKFSAGGKISFKREEEKSEQELAREEKEREIEERLARQREELAKERETRKAAKGDEKNESPKAKLEKTEKVEKVEEKTEQPVEEKRIAKFSNSKKAEKAIAEPVVEQKVQEVVAEVKLSGPAETVEMNGTLSNKAWGDGPLLKKAQKK